MMKKLFFCLFVIILLIEIVSSAEVSVCCEKTKDGKWCVNMDSKDKCDTTGGLKAQAGACEVIPYCKLGCCIDSNQGICSSGTPKRTCETNGGTWANTDCEDNSACKLGCCIVGNTAFWDTLTGCKKNAGGLNISFTSGISSELECLTSKDLNVKGACVFEGENGIITCNFITKAECDKIKGTKTTIQTTDNSQSSGGIFDFLKGKEETTQPTTTTIATTDFKSGYLCSATQLHTNCYKTEKTTCFNEKVYFVDSCGNIANIYNSELAKEQSYWEKIVDEEESCGYGESNANSKTCGNCNYFAGSICGPYKRGVDAVLRYGNYICRDLSCKYDGQTYKHGESWCVTNTKIAKVNAPGSEYFKLSCRNGEVTAVLCDNYRNKVCYESELNGYKNAQCVVNQWDTCSSQINEEDCENSELRDCKWISTTSSSNLKFQKDYCVPSITPGINFWEDAGTCTNFGNSGMIKCVVKYEDSAISSEKCIENCPCTYDTWQKKMAQVCSSIGDCKLEMTKTKENRTIEVKP